MKSLTPVIISLLFLYQIYCKFDLPTYKSQFKLKSFQPFYDSRIDQNYESAQQNLRSRRIRKALKVQEDLGDDEEGILGWLLGFAQGLQYNLRYPGQCFHSIENHSLLIDEAMQIFKTIYIPENWGDAMFLYQDFVDVQAAIYTYCDLQQFLNNVAALFTTEGIANIVSRSLMGLIYEIPRYYTDFIEGETTQAKGKALGHLTQIIFDYSIL